MHIELTKEEIAMILEILSKIPVQGIDSMKTVVALVNKLEKTG